MQTDRFDKSPEGIVERYSDMVYRIAMVQMKNKYDADDIFQEVFLRLLKYIDSLESEEHLKAWLIRVTVNCCHTHHTSSWEQKTVSYEENVAERGSEEKESSEAEDEVYEAVKNLPDKYKSVIHLFYYEELSIKEISACLDMKETTVKVQLSRARDMLKKTLKGEFGNEGRGI